MNKLHTDKKKLVQGIRYMAFALPLLFISPYVITLSALNRTTQAPFYIFLFIGVITGIAAIFLCFKGIRTILKALF